jgi:hypothetical protein
MAAMDREVERTAREVVRREARVIERELEREALEDYIGLVHSVRFVEGYVEAVRIA